MSNILFKFELRSVNKVLQFTGLRIAIVYDTNDAGEIISGQPVKMAIVWHGFRDFILLREKTLDPSQEPGKESFSS